MEWNPEVPFNDLPALPPPGLDLEPKAGPGGTGADPMAFSHAAHRALIADFVAAIRAGRPPRAAGAAALQVQRLIEAIRSSGGSAVDLP